MQAQSSLEARVRNILAELAIPNRTQHEMEIDMNNNVVHSGGHRNIFARLVAENSTINDASSDNPLLAIAEVSLENSSDENNVVVFRRNRFVTFFRTRLIRVRDLTTSMAVTGRPAPQHPTRRSICSRTALQGILVQSRDRNQVQEPEPEVGRLPTYSEAVLYPPPPAYASRENIPEPRTRWYGCFGSCIPIRSGRHGRHNRA